MGAILIKNDAKSLKLITELAKRLGSEVAKISDEELEDLTFGEMMAESKTGERVNRETIMKKLK